MATQEEIEEIRKLNIAIEGLETERRSAKTERLQISLGDQITAKQNSLTAKENRLTALITSQQGTIASHISIVLSQSSRCNPLPNLFRHLLVTHYPAGYMIFSVITNLPKF